MTKFIVHTKTTAPEQAVPVLEAAEQAYGFIPNLLGVMANSPATVDGYRTLMGIFEKSSFTPTEQQIVLLAVSRYNECVYCVAAHTVIADMQKVPQDVTDAIRNDRPIADKRLEALRHFTTKVVDQRGWISQEDQQAFIDAGFTRQQVLEVILGVSIKTLSNYVNHAVEIPLDDAFSARAWKPGNNETRDVA